MPLAFKDFSAWIEVDGSELPLFDANVKGNEVSCWVPSEVGKTFLVKVSTGERRSSMMGQVYMDGQRLRGIAMYAGAPRTYTVSGALTSQTTEQPFVFSNVELTDDDQYLHQATAGLGDIKLQINHATLGALSASQTFKKHDTTGKVHEKAKKVTGHKVGLGDERPVERTTLIDVTYHDVIVKFVFKYRPLGALPQLEPLMNMRITKIHIYLDLLRANGIAPPAPHQKSAVKPEVLDLTGDSEEEDIHRMRSLEAQQLRRKRRKTHHVKTEPELKPEPA
ncbi:hypothetical protein EV360DRAFT_90017 [Lentinula raphanica]|nr:hypothetical protein EV360DRAFT_90017 [Lentinula raphanica]